MIDYNYNYPPPPLRIWASDRAPIGSDIPLHTTLVESPDMNSQFNVPIEYKDLNRVFSNGQATKLPPHHSYDCSIELLPGTTPPKGRVYPLSPKEQRPMEVYIKEALAQQYIVTSTSPASAGFFFVEKNDGGLRPCTDYRGLNNVLVKYPYPLPLVPNNWTVPRFLQSLTCAMPII